MGHIRVSGLGKAYKQYPNRWSRLFEWLVPFSGTRHHLHWVLQDIDFEIQPGEAVGIVGVNGAGKSTLLKMITGTTQPSCGQIQLQGRVAALLELGMVPMQQPETTVVLDTPAGLVTARAQCADGRCLSVSLDMVPAFVEHLDLAIETEAFGTLSIDVAFGGVYYALIDVEQIGLSIAPQNARALADAGVALKEVINRQVNLQHPLLPSVNEVAYVMFRNRLDERTYQTCTTLPPGRVDRSPCGTGSSANLATLAARGLVQPGDGLVSRSTIGGQFQIALLGHTEVAGKPAVLPRVTGRAWLYGLQQMGVDPDDPLAGGFMLSDTWGAGLSR